MSARMYRGRALGTGLARSVGHLVAAAALVLVAYVAFVVWLALPYLSR